MTPLGLIFGAIVIATLWVSWKIDSSRDKLDQKLRDGLDDLVQRLRFLEARQPDTVALDLTLEGLESKLDSLESDLGEVNNKIDSVESSVDRVVNKFIDSDDDIPQGN